MPRNYRRKKAASKIARAFRKYRKRKTTMATKLKRLQQKVYADDQEGWIDNNQTMSAGAGGAVFGTFCVLEQIGQGNNHDERTGDKITVHKLQMKGLVQVAIGDVYNEYRLIIFSCGQAPDVNAAAPGIPGVNDILQDGDLYSFYKKKSRIKYKIHYDHVFKLSNALASVGTTVPTALNGCPYPDFIHWEKTLYFKNHEVWYTRPTVGNPSKGGIYALVISNSLNQIPTGHPQMVMKTRLTYSR